jgi:hypothetical protein
MVEYPAKVRILAQLHRDWSKDEEFTDFVAFNNVSLPLAYMDDEGLAEPTAEGEKFIEHAFEMLLEYLGVDDAEIAFETVDDMMDARPEK